MTIAAVRRQIVDTRQRTVAAITAVATASRRDRMALLIVAGIANHQGRTVVRIEAAIASLHGRMDRTVAQASALLRVRPGIVRLRRVETLGATVRVRRAGAVAVLRRRVRVVAVDPLPIRMAADTAADANNPAKNKNAAFRGGVSFCFSSLLFRTYFLRRLVLFLLHLYHSDLGEAFLEGWCF